MAPSRGHSSPASSDDTAVVQQGNSALTALKRNFKYLVAPSSVSATQQPRLRTLRYLTQFIFWRAVRWAKNAAVGALVAGISATAIGSVVTGAAWVVAPPTIGGGIVASVVWGVGKFLAGRVHRRWERRGGDEGVERREREEMEMLDSPVRREGSYGVDVGPRAVPW